MGRYYYKSSYEDLGAHYNVTARHPFDVRDIVETFTDLLSAKSTFNNNVYEGMIVLVLDECLVYELISQSEDNRGTSINKQFAADDPSLGYNEENKKFWKRLTIETINANNDNDEAGALTRAKNNLVNGALIYIANDIKSGEELVQKSGLYFCQNVDGEGVLTMAGGGGLEEGAVTTDKIGNSAVTEEKIGAGAVTTDKIANGAVNADKLDTGFLNSLATKKQYDDLTAGMEAEGEGEGTPTIMGAINKAITKSINAILTAEY